MKRAALLFCLLPVIAWADLPGPAPASLTWNGVSYPFVSEVSDATYWYFGNDPVNWTEGIDVSDMGTFIQGSVYGPVTGGGVVFTGPLDGGGFATSDFVRLAGSTWEVNSYDEQNVSLSTSWGYSFVALASWAPLTEVVPAGGDPTGEPPGEPTESYQIFVLGMAFGATVRMFLIGGRWVKRVGDDREVQ